MKVIVFIIMFSLLLFKNIPIYSQNLKTISADYYNSYKSPILLLKGDTIVNQCDTLYIINNLRYSFYKQLHNQILIDSLSLLRDIIKSWENNVEQQKLIYEKLKENINNNDLIIEDLIKSNKQEVERIQKSIVKIEKDLHRSIKSLGKASNKIQKTKNNFWRDKFIIFSSGALIGISIGLLIN